MSKTVAEQAMMAATRIKEVFHAHVVVGGGGRGGKPSVVLNQATRASELLACTFADHFRDLDSDFDTDTFFRACCLRETFIEHMQVARSRHAHKTVNAAWKEAKRVVGERKRRAKAAG